MVDENMELPVSEEPTPPAEAEPKKNVDELLAELEKVGIEDPQQLQGKLDAGAQAGKLAQMLGDERKRGADLEAKLEKLMAQPQPPREDWEMPESRPADIEAAVDRSIDKAFVKREQAAIQAQQASIQAYNAITNDSNFHLVKDVWEKRIADPGYVAQITSGQRNPYFDYQQSVVSYFQNIAKESYETIKQLSGGAKTPAPHVESGETRSPANIVSTEDSGEVPASVKRMKELQAKVDKGYLPTEDELVDLMDSVAFAPIVPG